MVRIMRQPIFFPWYIRSSHSFPIQVGAPWSHPPPQATKTWVHSKNIQSPSSESRVSNCAQEYCFGAPTINKSSPLHKLPNHQDRPEEVNLREQQASISTLYWHSAKPWLGCTLVTHKHLKKSLILQWMNIPIWLLLGNWVKTFHPRNFGSPAILANSELRAGIIQAECSFSWFLGKFANLLLSGEMIAKRVQLRNFVCCFRVMEISGIFAGSGNFTSVMVSATWDGNLRTWLSSWKKGESCEWTGSKTKCQKSGFKVWTRGRLVNVWN
jgi:hypothetical protein